MAENGKMDHSNHDHHHNHNSDPLDYTAGKTDHSAHSPPGHDHGHGMAMSFYADCNATILFSFCVTSTWAQMFGSCVVVFIAATLYEGLKTVRDRLQERAMKQREEKRCSVVPTDESQVNVTVSQSAASQMLSSAHLIQVLLHIIQVGYSYLLMLIFMTYNVWLCLAVALGAGLGYFLFGWRRQLSADRNEHCH